MNTVEVLVVGAVYLNSSSVIRALLAPDGAETRAWQSSGLAASPSALPPHVKVVVATPNPRSADAQALLANPAYVGRIELVRCLNKAERTDKKKDTHPTADQVLASRPRGSIAAVFLSTVPPFEEEQARPLIDVALEHGVGHIVYASIDRGGDARSWHNPTNVGYFAKKHRIEWYLREAVERQKESTKRGGGTTWTILRWTMIMDNFENAAMCGLFTSMWAQSRRPEKRVQLVTMRDVGVWAARAIWASLEKERETSPYANRAMGLAGDELTLDEAKAVFRRVVGQEMPQSWSLWGWLFLRVVDDARQMMAFVDEEGYGVDMAARRAEAPDMVDWETYLRFYSGWVKQEKDEKTEKMEKMEKTEKTEKTE